MKKVIAMLMVLAMVFGLAACGGGNTTPNNASNGNNAAPEAAKWPDGKEITILSGYEAGSLTDVNIVTIADWIKQETGAKVTIENDKNGGGANLAVKLSKAKGDGLTLMLFGMNCISNYHNKIWTVSPTDESLFKVVCGAIQPYPYSGCMLLTHQDNPYNTWEELEKYINENPGKVTVMDIPGKVMDSKTKSIFIQRGLADKVTWAATSSAQSSSDLLGNIINIVMLDETTAAKYLADPANKVKAIINCRPDDDFSYYPANTANLDIIKKVPTLAQVFGAADAEKYNIPNTSCFVVPASTPDDIVAQIKAVIDKIGDEKESSDPNSFYQRCRINGGTSKYYTWDGKTIMKEYKRIDPILKQIIESANKK